MVVVLPTVMSGVGIGLEHLQRATPIISGFLLGYVAILPLLGRLSDLLGREPVFAGCLLAFAFGSVLTATAHGLGVLVVGRALQGLGGGGLIPVALSLVAAQWPPQARGLPLGIVGAVQELGSVLGPLYGAAVVAVAGWRTIFWLNLPLAAVLGTAFFLSRPVAAEHAEPRQPPARSGGFDFVGAALLGLGLAVLATALDAPAQLTDSVTLGGWLTPGAGGASWGPFTSRLALAGAGVLAAFVAWELLCPHAYRPLVAFRRLPDLLVEADVAGAALLAGFLACVVVLFSTADPGHQLVASSAPVVAPVGLGCLGAFAWRQGKARQPLLQPRSLAARPAWGALVVNLALGGALMAALIDVPFFARATIDPHSQVDAALVLLRFLVAVPLGAVLGGLLTRRSGRGPAVATMGMLLSAAMFVAMTSWSARALSVDWTVLGVTWPFRQSDVELVACGLGFGLVISPLNAAVLDHVEARLHGLATSLTVVARTVGMLAGLSALTAIGLRRFYEAQARIGSPFTLCPASPGSCPAYDRATNRALLAELHTIFAGAAVCALIAAVLAGLLLRSRGRLTPATVED
ncbi:MAG: MFS transporter [Candidatus Aeolococcus gillhamiae]|uniref:MFS transporter n=1 Tax=Candidatus Aeolococcus gillhamiae TaxID=3127015 RepID=A0A2W5Z0D9_9BACT|nr:MAG: MFS transporter [Candidatus Dormibacter sp. RRmetagenome_bin12]